MPAKTSSEPRVEARIERLRALRPFDQLRPDGLLLLGKTAEERRYRKRERILYGEQNVYDVLFVWEGAIDVVRKGVGVVSFGAIRQNEVLGLVNALGGTRHSVDYEALVPTTVLFFSQESIRGLALANPNFLFAAVAIVGERMRAMRREMALLQTQDPAMRVLHAIKDLQAVAAPAEDVAVTHVELARRIGARRETVTRALAKLSAAGLVECERGRLRLAKSTGRED